MYMHVGDVADLACGGGVGNNIKCKFYISMSIPRCTQSVKLGMGETLTTPGRHWHTCLSTNTVLVTSYLRDSDVFCSILLKFP